MLSTTDGTLVASSTPWSKDSVYYRMTQAPEFSKHTVTCEDVVKAGLIKQGFIDEMRSQLPIDRFQREFMAEFVEDVDAWLTQSLIVSCIDSNWQLYDFQAQPNRRVLRRRRLGERAGLQRRPRRREAGRPAAGRPCSPFPLTHGVRQRHRLRQEPAGPLENHPRRLRGRHRRRQLHRRRHGSQRHPSRNRHQLHSSVQRGDGDNPARKNAGRRSENPLRPRQKAGRRGFDGGAQR